MPELRFETEIAAPAETVFDLIADLRGYDRWLPRSKDFPGTTEVSDGPIGVGTTYVEDASAGTRRGRITEFERPTRIAFDQPMALKPRFMGVIEIVASYSLTPRDGAVHLLRVVTLDFPLAMKPAQPVVVPRFRRENERTLAALKEFAESGGAGAAAGERR
jgi:uncharacterized protein YndB with AHSA1/START domain